MEELSFQSSHKPLTTRPPFFNIANCSAFAIAAPIFFSQIIAATGWGDWFPWSVPALYSGVVGPRSEQLGIHSYILVILTGMAATFWWWRNADQTR